MNKRMLAENLYKLIETSEDNILKGECNLARDHELAPAIYRLLQDDKDSPVYPYVCCIMVRTTYKYPYARREYLEDAVTYLRKANCDEEKVRVVEEWQKSCKDEIAKLELAEERIVHPDAVCKIKGIELFDKEHLNFHDAYVEKFLRTDSDSRSDIELELKPTWTDLIFRFKFNAVVDFTLNSGDFVYLFWVSFYLDNGFLVCDMDGFGDITCHDAELLNAVELAKELKKNNSNADLNTHTVVDT